MWRARAGQARRVAGMLSPRDAALLEAYARECEDRARAPKGEICDLAREKTGATGEYTGRRLRELTEEGILEVQYRKGHAHYRLGQKDLTLFS